MFPSEAVVTKFRSKRAELEEFILADFETYGLTAEDLEVWYFDAVAVGKLPEYLEDLARIILGEDDYLDGLM